MSFLSFYCSGLLRQNGLVCRAISDNQDTSLLSYMTSSRNSTLYSGDSLVMQFAVRGTFTLRVVCCRVPRQRDPEAGVELKPG